MVIKIEANRKLRIVFAEAVPGCVATRMGQRRPTRREAELFAKELIESFAQRATKQEASLLQKHLRANLRSEDRLGMMEN